MTHRVRILRTGKVTMIVDIDDYEIACEWARDQMSLESQLDPDGVWAATLETGSLLYDPIGRGRDIFLPDDELHEGLVLDHTLLHNPNIDIQRLFGMK
jgi:hypothetical protein